MNNKVVDYLLVGLGLAGACVAVHLLKKKKKIAIIDFPDTQSATRVAAGLFNPVTGKNLSFTWLAGALFPYLNSFYQESEQLTGKRFFFPMPVYRPFVSAGEQNEWMSEVSKASAYVEKVFLSPSFETQVINPYGGLLLKQCGYLDTTAFLSAIRSWVNNDGLLVEELFDENDVTLYDDDIMYRGIKARKLILCQGISVNRSKFFSWLPVQPLKGEVLQLRTDEVVPRIYNRGVYVVPGVWKAGATYNRTDLTPGPTACARDELTAGLNSLIGFPYEISGQLWGVRPTVPDRRPIIGAHPEFKNIVVFNGLGTKGVSLAPYFSNQLVQWLENGLVLNNAVAVQRYKSLYWKSA
jgi:glycine/D-amino acid oxidase-like deaminating enzyme